MKIINNLDGKFMLKTKMDKQEFIREVEEKVGAFYDREVESSATEDFKELVLRMKMLSLAGGKRFRPYLAYLIYTAYGGKNIDELIDVSISSEILHSYILIHDDIIDNDLRRYGVLNITGQYLSDFCKIKDAQKRQNLASAMALLAGDAGHSLAIKKILSSDSISNEKKLLLLSHLVDTNLNLLAGQQMDTLNVVPLLDSFSFERLIETDIFKSSSYSTVFPMKIASILLELDKSEQSRIEELAIPLGILYQLMDDYSDYFSNNTAFEKKPKHRDYRQGKITHPYFEGIGVTKGLDLKILKRNFGNKKVSDKYLAKVKNVLIKCGAREKARSLIYKYAKDSFIALERLSVSNEGKQQISELINSYKTI